MQGSHLAPTLDCSFHAPSSSVSGTVRLLPSSISLVATGPALSTAATMLVTVPESERARNADTQADATLFSKPRFMGCDLSLDLKPTDVLPLLDIGEAPVDPASGGPPLRARLGGGMHLSLRPVRRMPEALDALEAGNQQQPRLPSGMPQPEGGEELLFEGPVTLSNVHLNQLGLVKQLSGALGLSSRQLLLKMASPATIASPPESHTAQASSSPQGGPQHSTLWAAAAAAAAAAADAADAVDAAVLPSAVSG
mmetsp:Transcript_14670/g.42944  ORF Transcript_14670/g.42944 Transcript_14670/m.42944 type:complete len:253 (+) Transcript_14670:1321-2079(+)